MRGERKAEERSEKREEGTEKQRKGMCRKERKMREVRKGGNKRRGKRRWVLLGRSLSVH